MPEALIAWGGWEGHEPRQCAAIVADMLREEGFAVRVENGSRVRRSGAAAARSHRADHHDEHDRQGRARQSLRGSRGWGGLGGYHGGMADAFRNEPAYQFMVGGQWVAHPGDIIDYRVDVTRPDDPIMAGIGSFPYRSEQYYMHVDPANEVLATTTFSGEHCAWTAGVVMPVVWKRRHGKGWVFYSSLGHVAAEFAVPETRTILRRGLVWAARRS